MQNALKSNEWRRNWVLKTFKIEIQKVGPNNSDFLQNLFSQKLGAPSLISRNFKSVTKKILWIIQNTWKSNEWPRIWVLESFKIEIQKRGPNNSALLQKCLVPPKKSSPLYSRNSVILQNWFPASSLEIGSHLESEAISENCRKVSTLNHVKYII